MENTHPQNKITPKKQMINFRPSREVSSVRSGDVCPSSGAFFILKTLIPIIYRKLLHAKGLRNLPFYSLLTIKVVSVYIFLFLFTFSAYAKPTLNLPNWEIKIARIIIIESSGNPLAYNKNSGAVGICQITQICLDDYNFYNQTDIKLDELYNPELNKKVAEWYLNKRIPTMLNYYNIEDTVENRLFAYNAGIGKVKKGIMPLETKNYIKKYENPELIKNAD